MDETTITPQRPSSRADIPRPSSADGVNITSSSPPGSRFNPPKPKDVAVYERKPLPPIPPKRRQAASISSQKALNRVKGIDSLANITGAGPPEKIKNCQDSGDIDWEKEEAEINSIIAKQLTPRVGTPTSTLASPAPRTRKPLQIPPADSERTLGSSLSQEIISPQPRSPVSNILQLDNFKPIKSHPDSPPLSPTGQIHNIRVKQLSGPDPLPEQKDRPSNSDDNATDKHIAGYISPVSSRSSFYSQYRDSTVSEAGSTSLAGSSAPHSYDSPVSTQVFPRGNPHPIIKNRLMVRKAPSPIPRPLQPRKIRDNPKGKSNKTARAMTPVPPTDSDHSGVSNTEARELYHETTAQIARNTTAGEGGSWAYSNALSHPPHPGSSVGIPSLQSAGGLGHARLLGEVGTQQTTGDEKRESQQPPPVRPPREDELTLALPCWDSAADALVTSDLDRAEEGDSKPQSKPRPSSQFSLVSHHSHAGSSSPSPFLAKSQNAALKTRPRNRAQTISVSTFGHHNELRRQWDSGSPQLEIGAPLPLALEDNLASITKVAKHGSYHIRNHSDGDYSPGGGDGENRTSLFRRSLVSRVFRRVSGSIPGGGASPSTPTPTFTPTTISTATATERGPTQYQTAAERYHDQSSRTTAAVGTTSLVHRPHTADSHGAAGPSSFSFSTASSSSAAGFLLPQTLKKSALAQKTNELFVGGRLARKTKSGKKRENLKNSIRVLGDGGRVEAPVEFVTGMDLLSLPEKPARQEGQGWL